MKLIPVSVLLLLLGCNQPAPGPSKALDSAPMAISTQTPKGGYDFDFSKMRIGYQPPAPPYPPEALAARIQGTVVVRVTIGVDGIPISAEALEGPIELRPTAEAYAMRWKFTPALLDGVPHVARFTMSMPFRLR